MRVLVCGSRTWKDAGLIETVLDGLDRRTHDDFLVLIEGGANGADAIASRYAAWKENWGREHYPADWDTHGKAAGPIRNQQMLDEGEPDLVVAFSEQPVTRGTSDMIRRAKAAGVPVWVVSHG